MPRVKLFDQEKALDKAVELFWKKGFHATSIQDLCNHLELSRSSLYDTFSGKEALFMKALEQYKKQGAADYERVEKLLDHSVRDFLRSFFYQEFDKPQVADHQGCLLANTTAELGNENTEVTANLQSSMESFVESFTTIIASAQQRGEVPAERDARALAEHLYLFYNGFKVVSKITDMERVKQMIDTQLDLLFA